VIIQDRRSTTEVKMSPSAAARVTTCSGGVGGFEGDLVADLEELPGRTAAAGGRPQGRP
jgi:hypothetical protein